MQQSITAKYPLAIRVLHWLMAIMIVGMLAVGLIMADMPKNDLRSTLVSLHKSFGVTILILAVLRLALRVKLGAPPLPETIPALQRWLAHMGHWALYGFMFLMPISGYVMSMSFGLPVKWFGIALPRLVGVNRARGHLAGDIHSFAGYALMGLIALHVGAVILHYFKEKENLLKRMT